MKQCLLEKNYFIKEKMNKANVTTMSFKNQTFGIRFGAFLKKSPNTKLRKT